MSSIRNILSLISGCAIFAVASTAFAHVSVSSPAVAGENAVLTFSVGHGCTGADTIAIRVDIPDEITALRAVPGPFGEPAITTSSTGLPLEVAWSKATARGADDSYYQFQLRTRVPNTPFQTLYFKVAQTCRDAMGVETVVNWSALPGEMGEEAAALLILPKKHKGWNKIMVPAELTDLALFDDAEIVWAGDKAYSGNPSTMELIAAEPGVEVLATIPAATEIWVKY